MKKNLYKIFPDKEPGADTNFIRYKYSDGLFYWFYNRVKYYSNNDDNCLYKFDIDAEATKRDHKANGCRVYFDDKNYIKLYELTFYMEFTKEEYSIMDMDAINWNPTIEDVVNYYYDYIEPKKNNYESIY